MSTKKPRKSTSRPSRDKGLRLLDEVESNVRRHVFLPQDEQYVAVVLWIGATHGINEWDHATRLPIISPEKRCGKSRLLDVIERHSHKPLPTVNATVAAVTRSISHKSPPTLLIDEADSIFGTKRSAENHEELRGLLNAGFQRGRPVIRWDVTTRQREDLNTFAMAALASIKNLPDTIMDRGPVIRMRRRSRNEQVLPFRVKRDGEAMLAVGKSLGAWVRAQTFGAVSDMPVEDRAADFWEPLIAVADAAGGDWPERARNAAKLLTAAEEGLSEESWGLELLRHTREVWRRGVVSTHSADLVDALLEMEESPWFRFNNGLDQSAMAHLLSPYGVRSGQVKIKGKNAKGYRLDGFKNKATGSVEGGLQAAWDAYLPAEGQTDLAEPGDGDA